MPPLHTKALAHLSTEDPVLGAWIAQAGPCGLRRTRGGTHFEHIAQSIVYQQLSGKAAATIHGRLTGLFGGRPPTPRELLATRDAKLRGVGLSGQKTRYLKDLARHAHEGSVPFDRLEAMDDEGVIATLTSIRGIGVWTAQMFLMFRLGRPDVLPVTDLGVQKAIQVLYRLRKLPSPDRVATIGKRWAPYRTVASWYLWRRVDDPPQ
jgi:DNA-3-methyladenine glycosylase II